MTKELTTQIRASAGAIEKALIKGNLAELSPEARVVYYKDICDSLGLNWRTTPFSYIEFKGNMKLYANKDCTEQLRKIHGVSISDVAVILSNDDVYVVKATGVDANGKTDSATGAVSIRGLSGEALCNALMKAETKSKRRLTLSICGLGMLDETETDGIVGARVISPEDAHRELPAAQRPLSLPREPETLPEPSLLVKYDIPNATRKTELWLEKRGFSPDPVTGYWEGPLNLGPKMEEFLVKEDA